MEAYDLTEKKQGEIFAERTEILINLSSPLQNSPWVNDGSPLGPTSKTQS